MAQYQIMRVTDVAAGPRQLYPHNGMIYASDNAAIDEAVRLNEAQDRKRKCDYYVVFKDENPYWSPDEQTVSWLEAAE